MHGTARRQLDKHLREASKKMRVNSVNMSQTRMGACHNEKYLDVY